MKFLGIRLTWDVSFPFTRFLALPTCPYLEDERSVSCKPSNLCLTSEVLALMMSGFHGLKKKGVEISLAMLNVSFARSLAPEELSQKSKISKTLKLNKITKFQENI